MEICKCSVLCENGTLFYFPRSIKTVYLKYKNLNKLYMPLINIGRFRKYMFDMEFRKLSKYLCYNNISLTFLVTSK